MSKITHGLSIAKLGDQEPIEVGDDEEDDNDQSTVEGGTNMNIDN